MTKEEARYNYLSLCNKAAKALAEQLETEAVSNAAEKRLGILRNACDDAQDLYKQAIVKEIQNEKSTPRSVTDTINHCVCDSNPCVCGFYKQA